MYIFTAPKPKVGEPLPSNIPASWGPGIMAAASVLAFAVLPAIHQYVPEIPAMTLTSVQGALGVSIGVCLWIHQIGSHAALNYFVQNIAPQLGTDAEKLLPQIEAAIQAIMQDELAKNNTTVADTTAAKVASSVVVAPLPATLPREPSRT